VQAAAQLSRLREPELLEAPFKMVSMLNKRSCLE
jgi:hypothetical protein